LPHAVDVRAGHHHVFAVGLVEPRDHCGTAVLLFNARGAP
jgi:hypothetical protein